MMLFNGESSTAIRGVLQEVTVVAEIVLASRNGLIKSKRSVFCLSAAVLGWCCRELLIVNTGRNPFCPPRRSNLSYHCTVSILATNSKGNARNMCI